MNGNPRPSLHTGGSSSFFVSSCNVEGGVWYRGVLSRNVCTSQKAGETFSVGIKPNGRILIESHEWPLYIFSKSKKLQYNKSRANNRFFVANAMVADVPPNHGAREDIPSYQGRHENRSIAINLSLLTSRRGQQPITAPVTSPECPSKTFTTNPVVRSMIQFPPPLVPNAS